MAQGAPPDVAREAGAILAEGGAAPEIIACLLAETGKKRPSEPMIQACRVLLEAALTHLRIAANGGSAAARAKLAQLSDAAERAVTARDIPAFTIMLIARAFAEAGLDVAPALKAAMMDNLEGELPPASPEADDAQVLEQLAPLAQALGQDPFAIFAELSATGAAFSADHRAAMAATLAGAESFALRATALGFLLDPDPAPGRAVVETLVATARENPAPSRLIEWLVRLRVWLPPARQKGLDKAIRALRPHAAPPVAAPRVAISRLLASMCDGAGAQSFFALVKYGRQFALAAFFVKDEDGVADAWLREGLSKRTADSILEQIVSETEAVQVPVSLVAQRLADALVVNLARQVPPPFGLLQITEALGLGLVQPTALPPRALAEQLLADQSADLTGPEASRSAHAASLDWPEHFASLTSWFEAGEAVDALLKPLPQRDARIAAVRTKLLPGRRAVWAGRCAWMAATLRASAPEDDPDWLDFALVARDLAGDSPAEGFPLFGLIAEATVEAFDASQPRGRAVRRRR